MANNKLQSLIEEICKDFGVKYKFTEKETLLPMFFDQDTREIMFNLSRLEEILSKGEIQISKGDLERTLRNTIKHEVEHLRVLEELEKRGIPLSKLNRGDYRMANEAYVENNVPTFGTLREFVRDITLEGALINPAHAYLEASKNILNALTCAQFLSEDEIKAAFKMNYPSFSDFLIDLKKIAAETRTVDDIPKSAEKIRKLKGVEIRTTQPIN